MAVKDKLETPWSSKDEIPILMVGGLLGAFVGANLMAFYRRQLRPKVTGQ